MKFCFSSLLPICTQTHHQQQQTDFLHKNKTIEAEIVTTLNNIESFGKWIHQTFFEDI